MPGIDTVWSQIRDFNQGVVDNAPTMPQEEYDESEAPTQTDLGALRQRRGEERDRLKRDAQLARNADAEQKRQRAELRANAPQGLGRNAGAPIRNTGKNWTAHFEKWGERVGKAPTPGGLGSVIAGIAFFGLAVVPVNGPDTRLQLIWKCLTGQAWLPGTSAQERVQAAAAALLPGVAFNSGNSAGGGVGIAQPGILSGLNNANAASAAGSIGGIGGGPALPARQVGSGPRVMGGRRFQAPYHISSQGNEKAHALARGGK